MAVAKRASFSGWIDFAVASIPIRAYAVATESSWLETHSLHAACQSPIEERKFCKKCGQQVSKDDLVRVTLVEGQWKKVPELPNGEDKHRLTVVQFTRPDEIDPLWTLRSYYLRPFSEAIDRSYAVLSRALKDEKVWAVVTYISHGKNHLAIIYPDQGGLVMQTLVFPEDLRTLTDYGLQIEPVKAPGDMVHNARLLVQGLTAGFDYAKHQDETRPELMRAIEAGEPLALHEGQPAEVLDLKIALETSVKNLKKVRAGKITWSEIRKVVGQ